MAVNEIYTAAAGVLSGALTGYLTNNLALKMIFKKYGPFGGIVLKTRDEFIASIADLVENELIDKQLLKEEFSRKEFKNNFKKMIEDFYGKYLYRRTGKVKIGEIPAFEENMDLLAEFICRESSDFVGDILSTFRSNFDFKLLLNEQELENIFLEMYNFFVKKMDDRDFFIKILFSLFDDLKDYRIEDMTGQKFKDDFKENILQLIETIKKEKTADESNFLTDLLNLFDLDKTIEDFFEQLENKRINCILNDPAEIEKFIFSDDFSDIEKNLSSNLKDFLLESSSSFSDLLNKEQKKKIEADIIVILKFFREEIKNFIIEKDDKINSFIFEIFAEEIESSSGLKKLSRESIYSHYRKNMTADNSPSALLLNYLDNLKQDDLKKLSSRILNHLSSQKIDEKYLDFESINYDKEKLISLLSQKYNSKISEIFPELFKKDKIKNSKKKISEKMPDMLEELLEDPKNINRVTDYIFALSIEKADFSSLIENNIEFYSSQIIKFMQLKNKSIINNFTAVFRKNLDMENNQFLSIQKAKKSVEQFLDKFFAEQREGLKKKELINFYDLLRKEEKTASEISDFILEVLYVNIPEFLEGKIKETVSANLNKLSDREVQSALEDFIGKELKPITYLGGFLGAVVGGLFSVFAPELSLISTSSSLWIEYLSSAFIYGGVGWLTNVIALWMIFHPYEKKYLAGISIPFSPGIVAKNRYRFAESMGYFVDRELLESGSTASLINDNRDRLTEELLSQLEEDNFAAVYSFLADNSGLISRKIMEIIKSFIDNYQFNDEDRSVEFISEFAVRKTADYLSQQDIDSILQFASGSLEHIYSRELFKNLNISNKQLNKIIPQRNSWNLYSRDVQKLLLSGAAGDVIKYILPKNIKYEFFNIDLLNRAERFLSEIKLSTLNSLVQQNMSYIAEILKEKMEELIEREKRKRTGIIENTLMSGAIYFADLDEFLQNTLMRINERRLDKFLQEEESNIQNIVEKVFQKARESKKNLYINNFNAADSLINLMTSSRGDKFIDEFFAKNRVEIEKITAELLKDSDDTLIRLIFDIDKIELENFLHKYFVQGLFKEIAEGENYLFSRDNIKSVLKNISANIRFLSTNKCINNFFSDIDLERSDESVIISAEHLNEILKKIRDLTEDKKFQTDINNILEKETLSLINYFNDRGSYITFNYFAKLFLMAGFDSLENNIISLFNSVKIKEMATNQVKAMDPAEIEAMFNSFAGKYFSHLKQYGWFGGIFGVIQILLKNIIEEGGLF
ncbi:MULTISPECIES: DUF445 family protein [unclassified Halanaerobium]|uniref:DUF445 family protein n=1 Tax=unclassified Halanaerobium TaxID=2641197 RepID=UPI000DF39DAF|nr:MULTISPECIES: DUF445 family protein [unclassified Halanaerobium]RCW50746.1 uncharacterized membrane protein YheB (UPF0754 family) [Halanaerobium sp. MA284_MarDTE_T2]RCW80186.1 uncharacterized membrane protein YheB (UPF0754 family) [Halanaerobium sp. DL-01]